MSLSNHDMYKKSMTKIRTFKLGELFSGPGGLAYGALCAKIRAGVTEYKIEHLWATDYDEDSCRTYINNICPHQPESVICGDVRKIDITCLCTLLK